MATEIIMPKAGMAMEEGIIIQWMRSVGDRIETGDVVLEIETDKTAMEVEAETSGYLIGIIHDAGTTVPVTRPIGWIGAQGEKPPAATSESVPAALSRTASADSASTYVATKDGDVATVLGGPRPRATPAARRRAAELGIRLADAFGTGPAGEIIAADVEALAGGAGRISPLAAHAAGKAGVDPALIVGSGHGGRILTRDIAEQGAIQRNLTRIQGKIEPLTTPIWRSDDDVVSKAGGRNPRTARPRRRRGTPREMKNGKWVWFFMLEAQGAVALEGGVLVFEGAEAPGDEAWHKELSKNSIEILSWNFKTHRLLESPLY